MKSKKGLKRLLMACGIVSGLFLSMRLHYHIEKMEIRNPKRFRQEVGYSLPENIHMLHTEARIFSLADGSNYEWLISSEAFLLPWVEKLGFRIGLGQAGWSHVTSFYEIIPHEEDFKKLSLDSVWRINKHSRRGADTSYIFIAGNHRIALIETFRP